MTRLILFVVFLFGSLVTSAPYAKSMSKSDLVAYVAGRTSLSHAQAAEAVDSVFDAITEALAGGDGVRLAGCGSFEVRERGVRVGRNPRTGERIQIPAKKLVIFRASHGLKAAVNSAPMAAPTDEPQDEGSLRDPRGEAPSDPGQVLKVTDESFEHDVLKAPGPILLEFWAEWSGPNKQMAPALEEIAVEMVGRLTVAKINIDENPITPQKYGVRGIPTLMLFKDGKLVDKKVGAMPKNQLAEWVESVLRPLPPD